MDEDVDFNISAVDEYYINNWRDYAIDDEQENYYDADGGLISGISQAGNK